MQRNDSPVGPPRRLAPPVIMAGVFFILLVALPALAGLYVDLHWFRSLGFEGVFTTMLWARVGLGLAAGVALAAAIYGNVVLALRLSAGLRPLVLQDPTGQTRIGLGNIPNRLAMPVSVGLGVLAGLMFAGSWEEWLLWRNSGAFGVVDPIFGRDVGFYIFTLPVLQSTRSLLVWMIGLTLALSAGTYLLRGGIRTDTGKPIAHRLARVHLSILGALFFVLLSFDAWLSMPELLYSRLGPVSGASYADVHARLPALQAKVAIAAVGAVLLLWGARRPGVRFAMLAVVLLGAVDVLGVRVYPELVHR
ncbi:MAG: UPF0182 family protein, partial [Myxococcales bacterium]|nr:UPF0182 family protein [Myxococcales bacterium]